MKKIKVAITDDKKSNRIVLADKLARNHAFEINLEAINGKEFLDKMSALKPDEYPHIVLMDLEMPIMDGIEAITIASSLYPDTKFVVITIFDDDDKIFNAIKAGACGYLLKEESSETLAEMLISLWESSAVPISPSIAYKILQIIQQQSVTRVSGKAQETGHLFNLSEREKEILKFLSEGLQYKEIAEKIFISSNTVKKHVINIYQKLHVSNKAQALHMVYTKNLLL